ncbi:MAG: hypothetical protein ACXVBU_06485 [Ktedonobacteraceae bacterium]
MGTTRLWETTLKKLRVIAALTDTSIVRVIDRLADAELKRLGISQEQLHEYEQKK